MRQAACKCPGVKSRPGRCSNCNGPDSSFIRKFRFGLAFERKTDTLDGKESDYLYVTLKQATNPVV